MKEFTIAETKLSSKDAFAVFNNIILWRWQPKVFIACIFFASFFYFSIQGDTLYDWGAALPIALGASILLMVFVYLVDLIFVYFQIQKLKKSALFATPFTIDATENGFQSSSERGETKLRWSDFKEYKEIKTHFYLKTYEGTVIILPIRSFDNASLDNFREALRENIKK